MAAGLLLILQIIFSTVTTATVYNYNKTSEIIPYRGQYDPLSGFRDVNDKDFVIGGLFPVYSCTGIPLNETLNGLELTEAMLFAIDRVNSDTSLLANLTIGYEVRDTCNNEAHGLQEALYLAAEYYNHLRDLSIPLLGVVSAASTAVTHSVATLIGLEISQFPLISCATSDAALSNKDIHLLRTIPSDNLQANAMVDLISHFGWEYVGVIFSDNEYEKSGSDAFIGVAMEHSICIEFQIAISSSKMSGDHETIVRAVENLLNSKTFIVVIFADEDTVLALFEELNRTNSTSKFVWIASDEWASATSVRDMFPEIAKEMFGFRVYTEQVEEFTDYYSHINNNTNIRNPFFQLEIYRKHYCDVVFNETGSKAPYFNCPEDLTDNPNYSHEEIVPFVIDAVYAFAHGVQDFLDDNCDSPLRWNRTTHQCDGMKFNLTGESLLEYLYNVNFKGIENRSVSFDENGDPPGVHEIIRLQISENGTSEYVSVGFWTHVVQKTLYN